jgi:hypothetical protein
MIFKRFSQQLSALNISFINAYFKFKKKSEFNNRFEIHWLDVTPCLNDKTALSTFDQHYVYHPAWAARILNKLKPEEHVDISSILQFSTLISAFIPTKFYDFRPARIYLDQLTSGRLNIIHMPFADNSIPSLSCLHTVEHIGLGRYGDSLDPEGDLKAINELIRVLSPNGNLLFVVPVGKPKIIFNAHRIYSYEQVMNYFSKLQLREFSLIPDNSSDVGMITNATKEDADNQRYGCGCFWFTKVV